MPVGSQETKEPAGVEDIFDLEGKTEKAPRPDVREAPPDTQREAAPEVQPEKKAEQQPESEDARQQYAPPPAAAQPPPAAAPAQKSAEYVEIENILSDHLDELYSQMPPETQTQFRIKGEETTAKLEGMLQNVKIKVKEVLGLIRDWLSIIPGINKFFLEQEAKIKADRILNLHEQKHKKQ